MKLSKTVFGLHHKMKGKHFTSIAPINAQQRQNGERQRACAYVFNPNWIDNNEKLNNSASDNLSHSLMCSDIA